MASQLSIMKFCRKAHESEPEIPDGQPDLADYGVSDDDSDAGASRVHLGIAAMDEIRLASALGGAGSSDGPIPTSPEDVRQQSELLSKIGIVSLSDASDAEEDEADAPVKKRKRAESWTLLEPTRRSFAG